jgi:hypothetical protein
MKLLSILATLLAGTAVVAAVYSSLSAVTPDTVDPANPNDSRATSTTIADIATTTHMLVKRLTVLDPPPQTVRCGGRTYSAADIEASARAAHDHRRQPVGVRRYPHRFGNSENLRGFNRACNARNYQEFPLMRLSRTFAGGEPGPDRVVVEFVGGDVRYCGAITHTGARRRNNFVACSPIFR